MKKFQPVRKLLPILWMDLLKTVFSVKKYSSLNPTFMMSLQE
jgi:hypothetical protein